jgi:hypothetical protein
VRWPASRRPALHSDYERRSEGTGKRNALSVVEREWFLASLADGSYEADEDVVLAAHYTTGSGESFFTRNRATVVSATAATPWVDPWVRQLFAGIREVEDAWDARDYGYAADVKPEGWKGFAEHLAAARRSLVESWRLRPDRPEPAAAMIRVAMGAAAGDSPRLWFDRAVGARLDHIPAYTNLIIALRTRWGADPGALVNFARECAETGRFDTDVPFMAYRAVEQSDADRKEETLPREGSSKDVPSAYREEPVYRLVATVLERYRRQPGGGRRWQWWASLEAIVAYKAGRYAEARNLVDLVGGRLEAIEWDAVVEPQMEGRIQAFASAKGEELLRAEDLYRQGRSGEALALYRSARTAVPPPALAYVDGRITSAAMEVALQAGQTVAFLPSPGMAGWTPKTGTWTSQADGSLMGTTGAKGGLVVADARVGDDFEIDAHIEVVSTSNGQFQVGIVFGPSPDFDTSDWSSFRVKRTAHEGDVVYFSRHFHNPSRPIRRPVALDSRVVVQAWAGRLWAYVDGEQVVSNYVPEWQPPRSANAQVGFGAYLDDNTVISRYRDVHLRRLTAPPTPPGPRTPSRGMSPD